MKILRIILMVIVVASFLNGCNYNFIVPFEDPDTDPDNPDTTLVSFKDDIITIFNDGNFCTSCHSTGKQAPDLTPEKAYASLNSTRYINSATPEESKIYKYPHPNTSTHKQKEYNTSQASKVLKWIQQGAKNN